MSEETTEEKRKRLNQERQAKFRQKKAIHKQFVKRMAYAERKEAGLIKK